MTASGLRGEIAVMRAGPGAWWCHSFDLAGDSGALLSCHRTKREALARGTRLAREMDLDLTVWRDS